MYQARVSTLYEGMEQSMSVNEKAYAVEYATPRGERLTMITASTSEEALAAVMSPGILYACIVGEC